MTVLAIDLGTSAIKFMRVDGERQVASVDRAPVVGLSVDDWLEALRVNLSQHGDGEQITRLTITGQMHGLIPLENNRYGEGVQWTDQRGTSMLPALNTMLGPEIVVRIGGPLASGFQAVSLAWIKSHDLERWSRIQKVMLPKDALIHALIGEHLTDPSDAVGTGMFDITTDGWAWGVIDAIGIPHDWLPSIVPSGTVAGEVLPLIATQVGLLPGTPVVIAGGDAPVGAVGGSVTQAGQALIMLSSGAQIILPAENCTPDPEGRWYTWPAAIPACSDEAPWLRVGTLMNAGNAQTWLRELLAEPTGTSSEPTRLIVLSNLIAERTSLNNPDVRGAILGITDETTSAEISRAMLESIAYGLRHALETISCADAFPRIVTLGGGGAHNDTWRTIITNVLGISTNRIPTAELSAYGAALLAMQDAPWSEDEPSVGEDSSETPHPILIEQYNERYQIYRDALDATAPISCRLTALKHRS